MSDVALRGVVPDVEVWCLIETRLFTDERHRH